MKNTQHRNSKQVLNAVLAVSGESQRSDCMTVHQDWIERLKAVIEIGREHLTR
jgi:hypothetical protein